jgi:hypothetical protein
MLKRLLIGGGLGLCMAACAAAPPPRAAVAKAEQPPAGCVAQTGSRIPSECPAAGREYDQRDIRTTGQTDAQQALRMLDSSVTLKGR